MYQLAALTGHARRGDRADRDLTPATVLIADDHSIVIEGLRRVLEPAFTVVGAVSDGRALVEATIRLKPAVVIADVSMPILNGIEAARQIRQLTPSVKVVFFTMHSDVVYASEALRAGGSAYVIKSSVGAEIVTAIREALAGRIYVTAGRDRESLQLQIERHRAPLHGAEHLSLRQREVLQLAARGRKTKEIAETLGISPRTVEFHRYQVMKALHLYTIAELVQYAIKHGLVVL